MTIQLPKSDIKPMHDFNARVCPHPFQERSWCVYYTFPSGTEGMKAPFPSKRAAQAWAKAMQADRSNQP